MMATDKVILVVAFLCIVSTSDSTGEIQKRHPPSEVTSNFTLSRLIECRICPGTLPHCVSPANPFGCQCDAECYTFNDCCDGSFMDMDVLDEECTVNPSNVPAFLFKCNSVVTNGQQKHIAVYVVSKCPHGWLEAEVEETYIELRTLISANCNTTSNTLPPVSDYESGLVYKNEYCALCHGVRSPVLWSTFYSCYGTLTTIVQQEALTRQILSEFCVSSYYYLPSFQFMRNPPRFCTPSISTCLPENELLEVIEDNDISYAEMLYGCENGPQNLLAFTDEESVFRNEYCALCNDYYEEENLHCYNNMTHTFTMESELQLALLLDAVDKMAYVTSSKVNFSTPLMVDCQPGMVFNANANRCLNTVCSFVNGEATRNDSCRAIENSINLDGIRITSTTENNELLEIPTNSTEETVPTEVLCQSLIAIEDESQYVVINQTLIFYKPLGVIAIVIRLGPTQLPIICLDFARPFINPDTLKLFLKLQRFYGGLVFVASIISAVFCTIVIAVYLLRPMRSVFGVVVINIAIIFLVSDVVIILVAHSAFAIANQGLCLFAAIAEQFINIALFVWLAILAVDVAIRYHRSANSLQPRSKKRVTITYLLIGWIIPVTLTVVGIVANFVSRGAIVQYGLQGSCHINHPQSVFALLAIPDLISIITAVVALIVILVLLCKVHYSFDKRDKCRFLLLFIFYPIALLLWFIWFLSLGGRLSSIVKFILPVTFLVRSIFFFFMVAFSKKVLSIIRGIFGLSKNKISPSAASEEFEPHPQHKEGQRDSMKSLAGGETGETKRESFAAYLENPTFVQPYGH